MPLLTSPIGGLVTRPWFDRAALWGLSRWAFPLSRAWAAGSVAEGAIDRFLAALPLRRLPGGTEAQIQNALARTAALRRRSEAAAQRWEAAFFGEHATSPSTLAAIDRERRRASNAYMMARWSYLPLRLRTNLPAARFAIPDPARVEAEYRPLLADPESACDVPDPLPPVQESQRISGPFGTEYWLRFPSPCAAIGDTAWAHVFEPVGVPDPATLVYIHGLGVELESLDGIDDQIVVALAQSGVRVVRLDAPWHGRRRQPGYYGGEPFIAGLPISAFSFLSAVVPELATLVAWCRSNSAGRVAIGGVSLGALSAQLAACRARHWHPSAQPDALYLTTTTDDVGSLAFGSSLAKALGLDQALRRAGWTAERFARWNPLWEPLGALAMAPEDVVMVLGCYDDVTPFHRGMALATRWHLPQENVFLRDQGHFTVPLGLPRDPAPLNRLVDRLQRP
ncbi:alpha/beta hydrolase family protein [Rhodospirillaceae bacterium SYSU D60014]|uniref:alpha/beta hydrolase family protein n=1 Tax=Virgifigura deserti TaxID=2268457 RepID=UPI000E66E9CE